MKLKQSISLLFLLFLPLTILSQTSAMSFNIRYDNKNDKENWWDYRKNDIRLMLQYYQPDILGIQEGLHNQLSFIDDALSNYKYVGVGRDDGKNKGEFAAIFYNTKTMKVLKTQTYWLSETPDKVSVGWDASMERIVTYGVFLNLKTKDTLHVFNAHFDHKGIKAREKSAELILKLIAKNKLLKKNIIVMGDLNCYEYEKPILLLTAELDDFYSHPSVATYGPSGTFNAFDINKKIEKRIDYIFTKNLNVSSYRHIDDRRKNNLHLSDHLAVMIEFE